MSGSIWDTVALGRWAHDLQVPDVHNQVTAGGLPGHAERVSGSRDQATARSNCSKRIATWNVNTLYQEGKLEGRRGGCVGCGGGERS